jgi:hypothetical protein
MSRTLKDEPYQVRARKNGKIRHSHRCNNPKNGERRTSEVFIFYAHEISELETLKAETIEDGKDFSVIEETGYLLTKLSEWNRWTSRREFLHPKRISVEKTRNLSEDICNSLDEYEIGKYNIFSIVTVTSTHVWGDSDPCCGPEMPAKLIGGRKGCRCCSRSDRREELINADGSREKLSTIRKEINSGNPFEEDFESFSNSPDFD